MSTQRLKTILGNIKYKVFTTYRIWIQRIIYLSKPWRIGIGVFFMLFGFVNLFNPFINGFIFLFGGAQVLLAKKYELCDLSKKYVKRTVLMIKTFFFSKSRRLGFRAKMIKRQYQDILQKTLQTKREDT